MNDELTYKVIGCAMKVHNVLGNRLQEVIYQRRLAIELEKAKVGFMREVEQTFYYPICFLCLKFFPKKDIFNFFALAGCSSPASIVVQRAVGEKHQQRQDKA